MKIICVDNFNRDNVSDILVCSGISNHNGKVCVYALNSVVGGGENTGSYYKLVDDNHVLYEFKP
ncbi:hypothetical protein KAU11_07195 [Candidatus Babeliales bacterium]|nr:hypothetical protein [Candidatus Babeliales bacterium]